MDYCDDYMDYCDDYMEYIYIYGLNGLYFSKYDIIQNMTFNPNNQVFEKQ